MKDSSKKFVGAHVSMAGGVQNAPLNARAIGARAFAMFTKNQKRWEEKPLSEKNIIEFGENLKQSGIDAKHILAHDGYLINLAHPEPEPLEKSRNAFIDEMGRCSQLGIPLLNFHPGATLKKASDDDGLKTVAESLNIALDKVKGVVAVIETTAGQGSNLGHRFEHIARIIELVDDKTRVGVCIDTCHIFAAGYDLRSPQACDATFEEFERVVGFHYLRGMHINDAKSEYESRVDRHHSIGEGNLKEVPFQYIMNDDRFDGIPLILETIDDSIWDKEIDLLYSFEKSR